MFPAGGEKQFSLEMELEMKMVCVQVVNMRDGVVVALLTGDLDKAPLLVARSVFRQREEHGASE